MLPPPDVPERFSWHERGVETSRVVLHFVEGDDPNYPQMEAQVVAIGRPGTNRTITADTYGSYRRQGIPVRTCELAMPEPVARRLISHFFWHHDDRAKYTVGGTYSNCHTFTAERNGWLDGNEFDPNLIGSGGLVVSPLDFEIVKVPFDVLIPGQTYGLSTVDQKSLIRCTHTAIALDPMGRHMLFKLGWGLPVVIGSLEKMLAFYGESVSQIAICHIPAKPYVVKTDMWKLPDRLPKYHGGGDDARLAVDMLERIQVEKPVVRAALMGKSMTRELREFWAPPDIAVSRTLKVSQPGT